MKLFLPDRIEVAVDRLGPLFGFTHLDGHIGVTGAGLIFSLQSLSTDNYNRDRLEDGKSSNHRENLHHSELNIRITFKLLHSN